MEFILSETKINNGWPYKVFGKYFIHFERTSKIAGREIFYDTEACFIIGDTNISFNKALENENYIESVNKNIKKLKNGYILLFDKRKKVINIYTDVFGFYHLFFLKKANFFVLSSNYNALLNFSDNRVDEFAMIDIILFNYTLFDRTLMSDIKRIKGGSHIILKNYNFRILTPNNYADNFILTGSDNKLEYLEFEGYLRRSLLEDLDPDEQNVLTITGGFDSRALLALCKNNKLIFSSFTFGQSGNIEEEVVKTFINDFSTNHIFYKLDSEFIESLENILEAYLNKNLDNPVILDLPHYYFIKQQLMQSNLITGFMGGEIISGQSLGSQVTFTNAAAILLQSRNMKEFIASIMPVVDKLNFINKTYLSSISADYFQSLGEYLYRADKINILQFLLNESYSKYFGAINKIFNNHSNLLVPFVDPEFIDYVLNSSVSFLKKAPFNSNPVANFKVKVFYAKFIKQLYPSLAETGFDRLYRINDLCKPYRIPKAAVGYIQSHLFKKNKRKYPRPHHYDLWFSNIVVDKFGSNKLSKISTLFNDSFQIEKEQYNELMDIDKKRLAKVAGINIALNNICQSK